MVSSALLEDIQFVPLREDHATLDEVFQLANITRPVGVHQRLHGLFRNGFNALLHLPGVAQNKIMHQERNVLASLAKRRNLNGQTFSL